MALKRGIVPLQVRWSEGYRRDVHRSQLPPGSLYTCKDMIPDWGKYRLKMREGWQFTATASSAASAAAVHGGVYSYPVDVTSASLFVSNGSLFSDRNSPADLVAGLTNPDVVQNPVIYRNTVIIPRGPSLDPVKWTGANAVTALTAAPNAHYASVHRSRLLLGGGENPNRVWVNGLNATTGSPDLEVWNTGNNGDWFDSPDRLSGFGSLRNVTLVFGERTVYRLRGSTPGRLGDMAIDLLFGGVGCMDAKSICSWNDNVIWADETGFYMSDGATLIDITERCGIKTDWSPNGFTDVVVAGVYEDWLFMIHYHAGPPRGYMVDLNRMAAFEITNVPIYSMWPGQTTAGKPALFAGYDTAGRVIRLSDIFRLDVDTGQDGDGDNVLPVIETQYFSDSPGLQRMKDIYVGYGLRKNAGDSTVGLDVQIQTSPASEAIEATLNDLPSTLSSDTDTARTYARRRVPVGRAGEGVFVKMTVNARARDFGLQTLELESWPQGTHRVA